MLKGKDITEICNRKKSNSRVDRETVALFVTVGLLLSCNTVDMLCRCPTENARGFLDSQHQTVSFALMCMLL